MLIKRQDNLEEQMDQDKYQQMQVLDYQTKQLHKIIENIDAQLLEMSNTSSALKDFEKLKNNDEILFPVANGIFAKGKLTDNHLLRINIGSDVVVEKSVKDTITMMETQAKEIENYKTEVMSQLQKFMDKMNELQEE
jgi:prefoldin alpha subunit